LMLAATACPSEPESPPTPPAPEPVPSPSPAPGPEPPPGEVPPPPKTPTDITPPPSQEPSTKTETAGTNIAADFQDTLKSHFGFMPANMDFAKSREAGGAYDRPFFELFQWDMIERQPGFFDFQETDRYVSDAQGYGLHILANIQPFAAWDQAACRQDLPAIRNPAAPGLSPTKGAPCDMAAYQEFVTRLVERYDGDNIDDMPGLTMPIKHWEVMNEPEFCNEPLVFFQGDAADYYEILRATYEAVKSADPEALVVQGGMAGMAEIDTDFWQIVFDLGGADYLDIMNMHSIGHGEHLNTPAFQKFLADNDIAGKPVWVTEVQYQQSHQTQSYSNEDFAKILARSYIFALANGVDKLFYVNLRMPRFYDAGIPFDERSALVTDNGENSALFQSHLTIVNVLGDLSSDDEVEIIRESIGDWHIDEGQYKFVIQGQTIYALWGSGPLPAEINGEVTVIDITGTEKIADASAINLTDSPIFIIVE
jgi:hypothetical protein